MAFFIPALIGSAATIFMSGDSAQDQKDLYELYTKEISRGNYEVFYDATEGVFVNFKSKEIFFSDKDLIGQKFTCKVLVNDKLQPIQQDYWDLNWNDWGRSNKNNGKPLADNEKVDVYWKGLFNSTRAEYNDARQSHSTTAGELNKRIEATKNKFHAQQVALKAEQEGKFNIILESVKTLSEPEKKALFAGLPSDAEIDKFNAEFSKETGIDLSAFDKKEAFITIQTGLHSVKDQPVVRANFGEEFTKSLDAFGEFLNKSKQAKGLASTVAQKLETTAPTLAPQAPPQPTAPSSAPKGLDSILAMLPDSAKDIVKSVLNSGWGKPIIGLLLMTGGGALAAMLAPLAGPFAGAVSAAGGLLAPLVGLFMLVTSAFEFFKGTPSTTPTFASTSDTSVKPTDGKSRGLEQTVTNAPSPQVGKSGKASVVVTEVDDAATVPAPSFKNLGIKQVSIQQKATI